MTPFLTEQAMALLEPLGFVWAFLFIATVVFAIRRRWGSAIVTAIPVVLLFAFGSTDLPGSLVRDLERPYAGTVIDALPQADAIVLLGGGAQPARFEVADLHFTPAGDRIIMALELARLRKAPTLVLGGNVAEFPEGNRNESDTVRDWLATRHLTDAEIIPLPPCGDTHDEAMGVSKIARERGWTRVLLVTSANHMRRASATFRKTGLQLTPAPCNFMTELSHAPTRGGLPVVPRAGSLAKTGVWLHEQIGWIVYRRRGWID